MVVTLGIKAVLSLVAATTIVSVPPLPSERPVSGTVCIPGVTVSIRGLTANGAIVGGWLTGDTVTVKLCLKTLTPPLATPPLSITVTVIVAVPLTLGNTL